MKNVEKLEKDLKKAMNTWDERGSFVLAGVKNLSFSDIQTIEMYCDFIKRGTVNQLMKPMGEIAEVFKKYNISF